MYKYIKAYNYGYEEGIKSCIYDYKKNKLKYLKNKKSKKCISVLYDIGYIDGYNKTNFILKNNLFLYEKK